MDVVFTRCAGLDVHKQRITACRMIPAPTGREAEGMMERRTCGTMTRALLGWAAWLPAASIPHVAMASPGEYWQPVSHRLEDPLTGFLVNAAHGKNVPGRQPAKADARWFANRMRFGLWQVRCIPPKGQRDWRDRTRSRTKRVQERVRDVRRVQGVLERSHSKLASGRAEIMGVSGRAMLEALSAGRGEPATMADLAKRRMHSKMPLLEQALTGLVHDHHRQWLAMQLAPIDFLDEHSEALNRAMEASLRTLSGATPASEGKPPLPVTSHGSPPSASPTLTCTHAVELLETLPGIDQRGAEVIGAEIGMDMARCETAPRLAAWAGVAPGNDASAGKQRSGKTRKRNLPSAPS